MGDAWISPSVGLGFAEMQLGRDAPGFQFGGTDETRTSTSGLEASASLRLSLPAGQGIELIGDLALSVARFPHAPELVTPKDVWQPGIAITVGLGIPLTAAYGAQGLAWAALLGVGLGQAAVQIPLAARACGFSVAGFAFRAFAPAVAIGLPVGLVMWRLRDEVAVGGLAALASWAGGALATYATLGWFFVLNGEERAFVKTHAQRIFVRLDPTGNSR